MKIVSEVDGDVGNLFPGINLDMVCKIGMLSKSHSFHFKIIPMALF